MDLRNYFNVEVVNKKETNFFKNTPNNSSQSTTDGSTPFLVYNKDNQIPETTKSKDINENKKPKVVHSAFTDGSTFNNGKKNMNQYGGIGVFFKDDDDRNICKILKGSKITNNVAELTAILLAIESIIDKNKTPSFEKPHQICLYTDSEYSMNCITKWANGWKKNDWKRKNKGKVQEVKNKNLIKQIHEYYCQYNIRFVHVRSHQPEPMNKNSLKYKIWYGNDMADKFATHASKKSMNSY